MTIAAQTDGINLGGGKELTHYTKAVVSGTMHFAVVRDPVGVRAVSMVHVSNPTSGSVKFTTFSRTTGTLAAGDASGAATVYLTSTNATPGAQAMRTPAQVLADTPGLAVGSSYMLRVINTGAGVFTLATDSGAGFTMTGTMTVAQNTTRDFVVTMNSATTGTVQGVGVGTFG